MKQEVQGMASRDTKALLKAIEIIIELSKTKSRAIERVKEVANELVKEPTDTDQGNR